MKVHEQWMEFALKEAEHAFERDEVPIGCIIVYNNRIIAKSYNNVQLLNDPTAHAEMLAITSAVEYLNSKTLKGCSMYVTLEPCSMCAGAIVLSKIDNLFFGAYDPKSGACGSILNIINHQQLNHKVNVLGGILDNRCGLLLKAFFERKRIKS